jgi:hypothetical protein
MTTMPAGPWVVVVGCHRSGTSAVTGALVSLGLHGVDPSDRMDDPASNPEHWESQATALWDEALLVGLGGSWDAPPAPDADWGELRPGHDGTGHDPASIMAAAYPEPGPLVWKDPRASLLLPYWRGLLPGPLTAVFVWRNPTEVARSLEARDGIPFEDGLALWEWYNRTAASGLRGIDTFVLDYASVVEHPSATITGLTEWLTALGRFSPWSDTWDVTRAETSVHADLVHHRSPVPAHEGDSLPAQEQITKWLRSSAGGHTPFDSGPPAPSSPWVEAVIRARRERSHLLRSLAQARVDSAEHQATIRRLEGELHAADEMIEGAQLHIERLTASTSWKITRPLRTVVSRMPGRPGA